MLKFLKSFFNSKPIPPTMPYKVEAPAPQVVAAPVVETKQDVAPVVAKAVKSKPAKPAVVKKPTATKTVPAASKKPAAIKAVPRPKKPTK